MWWPWRSPDKKWIILDCKATGFGGICRDQLGCIEIQCYAMGETYCKFLLGGQERIDAANFWITEGASAREIEQRLHQL
jgi:hypothetical protein